MVAFRMIAIHACMIRVPDSPVNTALQSKVTFHIITVFMQPPLVFYTYIFIPNSTDVSVPFVFCRELHSETENIDIV